MLLNQQLALGFFIFLFLWVAGLTFLFYRQHRHFQKLTKGVTRKDLKSVLEKLLKGFNVESKRIDDINKQIEKIIKGEIYHVQKVGLVRYNPFAETGGDQSFCLAILDGEDSGLVITSLHSRDTTRLYAKPVKKGKASGYELSVEEKKAIGSAKRVK